MTETKESSDAVIDSEKVKILSTSPSSVRREISCSGDQQADTQHRASLNDVSGIGGVRRKQVANGANNEPFHADNSFYNMGFSLSPSDLERSWKHGRPSMNGSIPDNSLRRTKSECKISIHRNPVDISYIDKKFGPIPSETSYKKVLSWLPKYKREFLFPDLIAGFTISILHIPQGMAYGVLAGVKAENGLYVSFFPVLIYFLLGTSKHISVGTFAVISLMLSSAIYGSGAVISREINNAGQNSTISSNTGLELWPPTHLETATTLAVAVGFGRFL
ncbi:solute carrier family 26 member 6 [Caerostris extrusa]|uniref:Solute carrier family 26 member 6 n=1 Tax=Caerostris extrusa TaxID=172846 RepID=A0AAV4V308_CAEEX|nr:solute carrier family 26 member 6 [Caerostris extrusa]